MQLVCLDLRGCRVILVVLFPKLFRLGLPGLVLTFVLLFLNLIVKHHKHKLYTISFCWHLQEVVPGWALGA